MGSNKNNKHKSLLSAGKASNTSSLSYLRDISPLQTYNLGRRNLDHLSVLQDITPVHFNDDVLQIGPSDQEVSANLDILVICMSEGGKQIQQKFRGLWP